MIVKKKQAVSYKCQTDNKVK